MEVDQQALDEAVTAQAFTGVVTVDVGDRLVLERCEGFVHRALGVPMTADARVGIASGSKAFTALAVMRLAEQGVLELEGRVREWLGDDLPLVDDGVTIEHLLDHTSGIGDYLDEGGGWSPSQFVMTLPVHTLTTAQAFLPMLDGRAQRREPGRAFTYCNSDYAVLAVVLERASGQSYHDAVRRLVLEPAGLERTGFLPLNDLPGDVALGYLGPDGNLVNTLHLPVLAAGDGGAFTTAADLHRFWVALTAGQIVSPATLAQMTAPRHDVPEEGLRSAMGFWLHRSHPALVIEGYDAGVSFRSTHLLESRTTVSVLGNSSEGAWPVIATLARDIDVELAR